MIFHIPCACTCGEKSPLILPLNVPSEVSYVGEDDSEYFIEIHGRKINSMNLRYMLPADADEVRVGLKLISCKYSIILTGVITHLAL